jgi:hypothetical protein
MGIPLLRLQLLDTEKALVAGPFLIRAPRFELGTSSPPDSSALWREVRPCGGKWLGYAESTARGRLDASLHKPVLRRLGHEWATSVGARAEGRGPAHAFVTLERSRITLRAALDGG